MCETGETGRMDKRPNCGYYFVWKLFFLSCHVKLTGWIGVILGHDIIQRLVVEHYEYLCISSLIFIYIYSSGELIFYLPASIWQ